ncbi:MAG TPA: CPBP family intramembrane glutamic endopeptidase [Candidatus Nanopelagicales bacterium]|nr:CPBP family intramembrane glutamic endopeptidase [Candidatus Nanopelagicales bacterium]
MQRKEPASTSPTISRLDAIKQIGAVALLLGLWAVALRVSGLGAWVEEVAGRLWLLMAVALQGAPALLVVAAILRRGGEPWSHIGLGHAPVGATIGRGLLAALACYLAQPLVVSSYLAATGQPPEALVAQKSDWMTEFSALPGVLIVPVAVFVGLYEEVLFRGFLQSRLLLVFGRFSRTRAVAVVTMSAVLFAVGHAYQGLIGVLQTLVVGLILGAATLRWGSVWPAIVAHVTIDTVGLSAAKYLGPRLQEMIDEASRI